jgi:rhodanese-related sulfurtransferase
MLLMAIAGSFVQAQTVNKLDPQNFEKQLKESKDPILVDVRTPGEYAQGHLANAVLIDIYSADFRSRVVKRVVAAVRQLGYLQKWDSKKFTI